MLEYFLRLFAHEEWANAKLIAALKNLPQVPPRTLELVRHLFAAHDLWDKRLHGETIKGFDAFPNYALDECAKLNRIYGEKWRRYLKSLPEPLEAQMVTFVGLDKKPHTYRVVDALTQLHAHSVHHRAQMMPDMRAAGLEPVPTDYIRYCAETDAARFSQETIGKMVLFESPKRSRSGPIEGGEPHYNYYRDSTRKDVAERKTLLEEWFVEYPDEHKRAFLGRFQNKDDDQHLGAMWELVLYHRIKRNGIPVTVNAKTNDNKTPDFLIEYENGKNLYIEATVVFEADPKSERRKQIFLDYLYERESKYFDLMVWSSASDFPKQIPNKAQFINAIMQWLNQLNWSSVKQLDQDGTGRNLPKIKWRFDEWEIELTAIPRHESQIEAGVEKITRSNGVMVHENTIANRIRYAVRKKAQKYPKLDAPLAIAVNVLKMSFGQEDIARSLFGADEIIYRVGGGEQGFVPVGEERTFRDCVFAKDDNQRYDRIAAVLFGFQVGLFNFDRQVIRLVANPFIEWLPPKVIFGTPKGATSFGNLKYQYYDNDGNSE